MVNLEPFLFTRDLVNESDFDSKWVEDVSYNENNGDLLVITQEDKAYLYVGVPAEQFARLEHAAENNDSVGSVVDDIMKNHGPSTHVDDYWYKRTNVLPGAKFIVPDENIAPVTGNENVTVEVEPTFVYPDAVRTEVQFLLNGDVKFMKSTKTVEEALKDYLVSVEALGLDAILEAVHVYFV